MKFCNICTLMMVGFCLAQEETLRKRNGIDIHHHFGRFGLEMQIGRGTSMSKPECIFLPPPPVLPTLTATCCSCHNNPMGLLPHTCQQPHNTESRTTCTKLNCPTDFPIGYHVTVASSHPMHAGKGGTVCQHTKKYAMFTPNKHSSNVIRILLKSLAAYFTIPTNNIWSTPLAMTKNTIQDRWNMNTKCMTDWTRQKLPSGRWLC